MIRFSIFFGAAVLLCCGLSTTQAQPGPDFIVGHTTIGLSPSAVITDSAGNRVHVLTSGQDADFNGVFEPANGDVSAGWYVLDRKGKVLDSLIFDGFFNNFPVRAGADIKNQTIYLPVNGRVASYSMATLDLIQDSVVGESVAAVSYEPNEHLLILSDRASDFTSPGRVRALDLTTGFIFADIVSGINPGMAVSDINMEAGGINLYLLNEGAYGQNNASVTRLAYAPDIYRAVNNQGVGGGGRQFLYDEENERVFILIPQAGIVRIIDAETHEELEDSPVILQGLSNPRSLALAENKLWITSWDGILRQVDIATVTEQSWQLPGRGEGVAVLGDHIFVTIPSTLDGMEADSAILVIDNTTGMITDTLSVGINPTSVFANPKSGSVVAIGSGEEGTGNGWWREINGTTFELMGSGPLPASITMPLRGAFDPETTTLAVIGGDTLFHLDLLTDNTSLAPLHIGTEGFFAHIANGDNHWLLTNYPGDFVPDPARLYAIDKVTGEQTGMVVGGVSVPMIPGRAKPGIEGGIGVYMIPDGIGGANANLLYADYYPNLFEETLGDGANHILHEVNEYGQGITAITMNGSHEIVFPDLSPKSPEIITRVSTGTSGFDGPRESALAPCVPITFEGALLVTTYGGEVLFLANEEVLERGDIGAKGEGIGVLNDIVFIANSFKTGSFEPASTVAIVTLDYPGSVGEENDIITLLESYPNPTSGITTLRFSLEKPSDVRVQLYDQTGRTFFSYHADRMESGEQTLPLDLSDLSSGVYFLRLQSGDANMVRMVEVVR